MKKIFFVLNKEKIYAYIISVMTIVTIFFMSSLINSDIKETEVTSTNIVENNNVGDAISTSIPYNGEENTINNEVSNFISNDKVEWNILRFERNFYLTIFYTIT